MNILSPPGTDSALIAAPVDDDTDHLAAVTQQLQSSADGPRPDDDANAGPVDRVTNHFASVPATFLRRLVLSGAESSEAIRTRRDELYRNAFPRLRPRFAAKCVNCGATFDDERETCPTCGGETRPPDPEAKHDARELFRSVNPAGESLRDVAKRCEADQWTVGVSTLVIQHDYHQATTGSLYREGEIYRAEPTALYRADPLALRPVVDERGHPGGWKWVCPIHRDDVSDEPGRCHCGAERREIHYVEDGSHGDTQYYLREEVISWAYPHARRHGRDGLAPAAHIWLKQAILEMMDRYGAQFYNSESDRLPNQFMILHTSNPDAWEAEMSKARDNDDQYRSPVFSNQINPQDNVQPEVEVVDAMPDELLGQSADMKSQFKSDIRQAFGIADVHDSDLEDAGGLNNEGLQLEVVDRSLASQMHDYRRGWLDTLMKRLGFEDWEIAFLPDTGADADALQDNLRAAAFVKQAGGDARIVDGDLEVPDFEVELNDSDDPPTLQGTPNLPGVGSPVPDTGAGGGAPGGGGGPMADMADVRTLERATFRALGVADAIEHKGEPVYQERADVPANVQTRIAQAVREHDFRPVESLSSAQLQAIFRERLTQPQGWSIDSLADHLQQAGITDRSQAETTARTEATGILNAAREDAVAEFAENIDETVLHYWDGPSDESTTEMCEWLKEQTNPEYGGDPVPMAELRRLEREALDRFTDEGGDAAQVRAHILHPRERHTHRSVLASEVNSNP